MIGEDVFAIETQSGVYELHYSLHPAGTVARPTLMVVALWWALHYGVYFRPLALQTNSGSF